jgi:hypothetical protein
MQSAWSQLDQAWRDTLIHTAQVGPFRRLSRWFGFIYQQGIKEGSWRRALLELAHGRRGTNETTFDVIRHVFRQYDTIVTVEVDPLNPTTLTFVSSTGLTAFDQTHVGRYIQTPYGRLWSDGPVLCGNFGQAESPTLTVSTTGTQWWQAPAWPFTVTTRFEVRILPFVYYERQPEPIDRDAPVWQYHPGNHCLIDVYFLGNVAPLAPTTYLQNTPVLTPPDVPLGGNLLEDEFEVGDPRGDGPHPLYLVDDEAFAPIRTQIQRTLAAGVEIRFWRSVIKPCQVFDPLEFIIML